MMGDYGDLRGPMPRWPGIMGFIVAVAFVLAFFVSWFASAPTIGGG
jgi:hypothetical protein